jgi:hypothetical protein
MGLFDLFKRKPPEFDQFPPDQLQEVIDNLPPQFEVFKHFRPGCNQMPQSYGALGSVTNPIVVNGVPGEVNYFNRLRGPDGGPVFFHRAGTFESEFNRMILDGYEVLDGHGQIHTLWFAPYHMWRTQLAPLGFSLLPYPRDKEAQVFLKMYGSGVNSRVIDFPEGLPAAIRNHPMTRSISPGLGGQFEAMATRMMSSIQMPNKPLPVPGPLNIFCQEEDDGQEVVIIYDADEDVIDRANIKNTATHAEIQALAAEGNRRGLQTLLHFAMLDLSLLTSGEYASLISLVEDGTPDGANKDSFFALCFAIGWLWHELTGRPGTDGTNGARCSSIVNIHWADLPELSGFFSPRTRDILNAAAARRG